MSTFNNSHIPKQTKKRHHDRRSQKKAEKHAKTPIRNLKSAKPSKRQMVSDKSNIQEAQQV